LLSAELELVCATAAGASQTARRLRKAPASQVSAHGFCPPPRLPLPFRFPREHYNQPRSLFDPIAVLSSRTASAARTSGGNFCAAIALVSLYHFVEHFRER